MSDIVKISKTLGDPIRYKILTMLVNWEKQNRFSPGSQACCSGLCNCDIMAELGLIQSRVSYHMKDMVDSGIVLEEQRGKWKYYSLNSKALKEYITAIELQFLGQ